MSELLTRYDDSSLMASPADDVISVAARPAKSEVGRGMLEVLWRRRRCFAASVVLVMLGCLGYLLLSKPIYTSTARIYLQEAAPGPFASDARGAPRRDETYLYAQAEFLRSDPILQAAINQPEARQIPWLYEEHEPTSTLKEQLEVMVGRKDHIISVSLDATNAQQAAQLVNAVVDAYVAYSKSLNRSAATELMDVLGQEKGARDAELAAKSKAVYEYKLTNQTLSFASDQGNIINQRLDKLSAALTEAELAAISAKATYEAAKAVGLAPDKLRRLIELQHGDVQDGKRNASANLEEQDARAELRRLESQMIVLKDKYGSGHSALRTQQIAIEQYKARIAHADEDFCEAYVAAGLATWRTTEQKAGDIRAQLDAQQQLAMQLNAKSAEYSRLESERSRVEKLCDALDARLKELNVSEKISAFNIHVLEPARAANKPSKPQKARTMAMGAVLGILLGIGLALMQEFRDERLHSADEIQDRLQLPLMGVIPHLPHRLNIQEKGQVVQQQPISEVAEAFRAIRTAIHFGVTGHKFKTLLITSPAAGEGKSSLASNLSIVLAQAGRRVLLLEADLRKPVQHAIFGLDDRIGLMSVLRDELQIEHAIRPSSTEHLSVLTCGRIPSNPAEILGSESFSSLLRGLSNHYDHIVIDSPPVCAVTDAQILSALADQTILVLRAQSSSRNTAVYASECLRSVGGRVRGVIVNDVPRHSFGQVPYGYGYGYGASQTAIAAGGSGTGVLAARHNGNGA